MVDRHDSGCSHSKHWVLLQLYLRCWKSTSLNRDVVKWSTKYLIWKCVTWVGMSARMSTISMSEHHIGTTVDLWKLSLSPIASSNRLRREERAEISSLIGTYIEIRMPDIRPLILVKIPISLASLMSLCKGLMAMKKRRGERGSPWRRHLSWRMGGFSIPLRSTHEGTH